MLAVIFQALLRILPVFLLHQKKFLCLAVLQGRLKVLYNFNGSLVDAEPEDPASEYLKISDGEAKSVSLKSFQLFV